MRKTTKVLSVAAALAMSCLLGGGASRTPRPGSPRKTTTRPRRWCSTIRRRQTGCGFGRCAARGDSDLPAHHRRQPPARRPGVRRTGRGGGRVRRGGDQGGPAGGVLHQDLPAGRGDRAGRLGGPPRLLRAHLLELLRQGRRLGHTFLGSEHRTEPPPTRRRPWTPWCPGTPRRGPSARASAARETAPREYRIAPIQPISAP